MKKINTEKFIEKANALHCHKYDYTKTEYVNTRTKVCITCPIHGDFYQTPSSHLYGYGCALCGRTISQSKTTQTLEQFVEKARKTHGNKYDYSKVEYKHSETPVCIICHEHGEFWQTPHSHLNGCGCPHCKKNHKLTTNEFVEKAQLVHGDKYDYSSVEYVNNSTKVQIVCPTHGVFYQTPNNHLSGSGCPKCSIENNSTKHTYTNEEFIAKSGQSHGTKYDYSKTSYKGIYNKVCIICPKHGEFWQRANDHINLNTGCPKCANQTSKPEEEIMTLLQPCNPQQRNRLLLKGKEIDIYLRDLKLGIEYNGLRWHSEEFGKDHRYHLDKLNECNKQGIRLIQIFEDEWVNHKDICISKLKQICGLNTNPKIYARKCAIREIKNKKEVYDFLDKNHIQGQTGCMLALGAYYGGQLVSVMCFKKEKEGFWDLNRFASDINYQCIGLGSKLFKYFTDNYPYQEVKSFADRRWTVNPKDNLYTKLGFKFDSYVEPTYWYFKEGNFHRCHKFGFRKQPLHRQYGLPLTMTEREMTTALGYVRIWDCGLIKYVYTRGF